MGSLFRQTETADRCGNVLARFAGSKGEEIVGVLSLIGASLARVEVLIGRAADAAAAAADYSSARQTVANYYDCRKMTLEAPAALPTRSFFEACVYKVEAILPQLTWKLDVTVMRKFLR